MARTANVKLQILRDAISCLAEKPCLTCLRIVRQKAQAEVWAKRKKARRAS